MDATLGPARGQREFSRSLRAERSPEVNAAYDEAYSMPLKSDGYAAREIAGILDNPALSGIRREAQTLMDLDEAAGMAPSGSAVAQIDYAIQALQARAQATMGQGAMGRMTPEGAKLGKVAQRLNKILKSCLLYTSPSPRDRTRSRMPSSA